MRRLAWLIGLASWGCHGEVVQPGSGEPIRFAKIHRGNIADRVLLTGDLHATSSAELTVPRTDSWQLAIRWMAEDGSLVRAGDKVLEFDNSAFTAQLDEKHLALLEAEMTLRGAKDISAIESAGKATELAQHNIALQKATVRADVPADLLPGRDAQERQLEQKRAEVAVKKAEQALAAQREEAALDLHIKQIELDKTRRAIEAAQSTIAELVLRAPRDGLIVIEDHPWLGRKIQVGDMTQPGMTVVSLPDMTQPMEVHAELSDVDDGRIALGMAGICTLDAYPSDPIACTVKELTPVARAKGESSLRRTFAIVLKLDKTDPARTRPGMSVKVELHANVLENVLVVPRGALERPEQRNGKGAAIADVVVRVRTATGELRDVTLGLCDAQGCAVTAGIADGDSVRLGGSP